MPQFTQNPRALTLVQSPALVRMKSLLPNTHIIHLQYLNKSLENIQVFCILAQCVQKTPHNNQPTFQCMPFNTTPQLTLEAAYTVVIGVG